MHISRGHTDELSNLEPSTVLIMKLILDFYYNTTTEVMRREWEREGKGEGFEITEDINQLQTLVDIYYHTNDNIVFYTGHESYLNVVMDLSIEALKLPVDELYPSKLKAMIDDQLSKLTGVDLYKQTLKPHRDIIPLPRRTKRLVA